MTDSKRQDTFSSEYKLQAKEKKWREEGENITKLE